MKNLKYFFMAALVAAGLVSCNNDEGISPETPGYRGKPTTAQLRLIESSPTTYRSLEEHPAEGDEVTIADNLDIYVFDNAGLFEKSFLNYGVDREEGNNKVTKPFTITTGYKYFYVFSNKASISVEPSIGTTRESFEKSVCEAVLASNNTSITSSEAFMIGTLWGQQVNVESGTTESPATIGLKVGRAAAKISLHKVVDNVKGNLEGNFKVAEANYRLHSIPTKFYLVAQTMGNIAPDGQGSMVISAVHNESPWLDEVNKEGQNPVFRNYDFASQPNVATPYYTIENTTSKEQAGLYLGNTTFVQLRIQYLPKDGIGGEVYSYIDATPDAVLNPAGDGTFYTAEVNGVLLIFNGEPGISIPGLDVSTIVEYEKGLNYYNIPIRDESETTSEQQYRVLRNHYYEMSVNSISRLGNGNPDVDPGQPIPEDKEVEISLTILPWSKISQGVDL